jgi:hypothetical protein
MVIQGHPELRMWIGIAILKTFGKVVGSDFMKVTALNRRLESLETAAKSALKSGWTLENLSREETAAKLKQYKEWFGDPDWNREMEDLPWLLDFEPGGT